MPKRSNTFQKLIHYIYTQLIPIGATIRESVEVPERESTKCREVDILIEYEIAGSKISMAVECRDHERTNTKEWIDALIGKYADLPQINKVIAVSSSGFTLEAERKAKAHGIETLTLNEALDTDWISEFMRLGMVGIGGYNLLENWIHIETEPAICKELDLNNDVVIDESGQEIGPLEELVRDGSKKAVADLETYLAVNFLEIFKALDDLNKHLLIEIPLVPPNFSLTTSRKNKYKIRRVIYVYRLSVKVQKIGITRQAYNDKALITTGNISTWIDGKSYKIQAVQVRNKNEVQIFWKPDTTPKSRKTLHTGKDASI